MRKITAVVAMIFLFASNGYCEDRNAIASEYSEAVNVKDLYFDLMKKSLTNWIYGTEEKPPMNSQARLEGHDSPPTAMTCIGIKRLDNIQFCVEDVLSRKIPGDLIECGAWRGGATIFMRGILKAYGVHDRKVYVADSFEGCPKPDLHKFPQDKGMNLYQDTSMTCPIEKTKANFEAFNLLDSQVVFLKGWFKDTLPKAPIHQLAVLRIDGDLYESTMDSLVNLYPKLSIGGYVIVDDYGCYPACNKAVLDYRKANGINDEIKKIDWTGVFWRKTK
jgi:hypothetical protein